MDEIKNEKEKQINNYISNNLNFENPNEISSRKMKEELKNILGEEPGVKLNYRSEELLSETDGKKKRIETLESITIVYTYEKSLPDGRGGVNMIPVPVEKEFLIN
jgi:hypothetical protein